MSFYVHEEIRSSYKLSNYAWHILLHDQQVFFLKENHADNIGTLVNKIIVNFIDKANTSIKTQSSKYKENCRQALIQTSKNEELNKILNVLEKNKQNELKKHVEKMLSYYDKNVEQHSKRLSLNKEAITALNNCDDDDEFFSFNDYINSLLEEYARLNPMQRENILLKDKRDVVKKAIKNKTQVKVSLYPKINYVTGEETVKEFSFSPLYIYQDSVTSFTYAVGITLNDNKEIISAIRIANIKNIKQYSVSTLITKDKEILIEEKIRTHGVMFLSGDLIDVTVKLDEKGLESLYNQVYMRPMLSYEKNSSTNKISLSKPIKTDDNHFILTFNCTELQAIYYFVKMLRNVEILEPEHLRNKFYKRYKQALNNYIDEDGKYKKRPTGLN